MPAKPLHLLVIEDNEDILLMLELMLQQNGYTVSLKDNINDLESYLKDVSPDIILMDMLLSGADGREVCKQLKSNPAFSAVPVIMLSAHPQARAECLAAGANFFLEKPFEMDILFDTVASAEKLIANDQSN